MQITDNIAVLWKHKLDDKKTNCILKVNDSEVTSQSKCVHGDQYSYAVGRKISLKNAMSMTTLSKSERTLIWTSIMDKGVKLYDKKKK